MNIEDKLNKIWKNYENVCADTKIKEVLDRGFVFSDSKVCEILITGINPSFNNKKDRPEKPKIGFPFPPPPEAKKNAYFTKLLNIVKKACPESSLGYTDLFYYRGKQALVWDFLKDKSNGVAFLAEQLALTQQQIEDAKPKLILVFNKGSYDFWGKNAKKDDNNSYTNVWMGYDFEKVKMFNHGKLCKITRIIESKERVCKNIDKTNLEGTLVYFYKYLGRTNKLTMEKISDEIRKIINGEIK